MLFRSVREVGQDAVPLCEKFVEARCRLPGENALLIDHAVNGACSFDTVEVIEEVRGKEEQYQYADDPRSGFHIGAVLLEIDPLTLSKMQRMSILRSHTGRADK